MSDKPVAWSYIRFSHPEQAKGDSLRRQAEAAAVWCERNGVSLDTSLSLRDLGKSAYLGEHRKNPDRHALAAFLKLVEDGKVPRGSYLVIENLDRLSREHIQPALLLTLNLLQAGVRIVQLKPAEMIFDDKSDTMPVMMMMMELSRGHSESAMKSERVGAAWSERKKNARNGGVLTRRLPAWIEESDGKLGLILERAAIVKRIFQMAASGYGHASIVKRFTEEKVPTFGPSGRWVRAYISKILTDRRPLGEFQPCGQGRKPDGEPIANYFPAVISEEEWLAARAGAAQRRQRRGRVGKHVNVFAGLVKNARDRDTYYVASKPQRLLVNTNSVDGLAPCRSFPFDVFEEAILSLLSEINPHDILNGDQGPDETLVLSGELAQTEASIATIAADLDEHGESPTLFRRLRDKEDKKRDLVERLARAREKAANPLSESWGEAQSLSRVLAAAPDPEDARLRLRSALRRILDSVWLLVVPRGRDRLAAVQVWFAERKRCRDYLILYRPALANRVGRTTEGGWWVRSFADVMKPGDLDLRKRADVKKLEALLSTIDPADIANGPPAS